MIDPTPEPQSSDPTSAPNREPNCPPIVEASMPVASARDQAIDDAQWAEIVLSGLSERSNAARQALLEALLNDEPTRSIGSSKSIEGGSSIGGEEASGYAGSDDESQASADTSPANTSARNHGDRSGDTETSASTVPLILPLRSNDGGKASAEDRINGERDDRNGGVHILNPAGLTTQ